MRCRRGCVGVDVWMLAWALVPAAGPSCSCPHGPHCNLPCCVVQEDTSLSKVYTLFRTLALRHVCVIPR